MKRVMMKRRSFVAAAVACAALMSIPGIAVAQDYPTRPISLLVPWSAGGGSDAVARILASGLEKELGTPVNVINRTGGNGVVGHQSIAMARPDGYTIGLITAEINMMHRQGLTDLTYEAYRPLALVNTDPASIHVAADSDFESASDIVEAIKGGETVRFSGSGQGSIWHLAMAGMLVRAGVDPTDAIWVPSQGAAPAMQELAAGGVEVVLSSVPEAEAMVAAGEAETITLMADERDANYPDLETLEEQVGVDWTVASSWRGIVAPAGTPDDVAATLETALKNVYESADYQDFMQSRKYGLIWADAAGLEAWLVEKETEFGEVMSAAGMTSE
jgi:tripartite-type tricarboxylate transporter receptor subunit TctC|nr:tripartite tricarboxylate transporter substrate binding protein [Halomonas sp.]